MHVSVAWHIPALPFGDRMGNSVSDTTTASRGRPASAEPAASDAPGGVDQNQDVPDEANESISAWFTISHLFTGVFTSHVLSFSDFQ